MIAAIGEHLHRASRVVELDVPYSRGDVLAALHREGEVLSAVEGEVSTRVRAKLPGAAVGQFAAFISAIGPDDQAIPLGGESAAS